jgi:hypothetical protein
MNDDSSEIGFDMLRDAAETRLPRKARRTATRATSPAGRSFRA